MQVTEFDKKVWVALKLIPRGKVTTYKAIAEFIGQPKAARAVGNACGKNPDAPRAPCHRVVKSNGHLGGYAQGVKKKIKLLEGEGVQTIREKVNDWQEKIYRFK